MATLSSCVRLAYEETPRPEGVATTTPYQISTVTRDLPYQSFSMAPNLTLISRADELGYGEDSLAGTTDSAAPSGSFTVRAYPDDMTWLFGLAGYGPGVYTAGDGVITAGTNINNTVIPAGASRWVFNKRTGSVPKTAQVLQCFPNTPIFVKTQAVAFSRLGGNQAGDLTGDMLGGFYDPSIADPNITPVYSTNRSLTRRNVALTWVSGSGSPSEFNWNINNPIEDDQQLGVASLYPSSLIRGDNKTTVTGSINIKNFKTQDAASLVNASTFSCLFSMVSTINIGATAYPYSAYWHIPAAQITGGAGLDAITGGRRRLGGALDWTASYDSTAGYECRIVLVNSITSIASAGIGN